MESTGRFPPDEYRHDAGSGASRQLGARRPAGRDRVSDRFRHRQDAAGRSRRPGPAGRGHGGPRPAQRRRPVDRGLLRTAGPPSCGRLPARAASGRGGRQPCRGHDGRAGAAGAQSRGSAVPHGPAGRGARGAAPARRAEGEAARPRARHDVAPSAGRPGAPQPSRRHRAAGEPRPAGLEPRPFGPHRMEPRAVRGRGLDGRRPRPRGRGSAAGHPGRREPRVLGRIPGHRAAPPPRHGPQPVDLPRPGRGSERRSAARLHRDRALVPRGPGGAAARGGAQAARLPARQARHQDDG